ncbi:DUF2306 domain-containing protein [Roseateles albus]|uniref:DUF2306 domain-containing protein n=1 Tax=Roseateles albus TaxID=2987525 RepID=A0ABT5KJG8_9BURK|nr:DUF2306 domain-containing protein [Roseateles albus]MDC8773537.1 DUF2306 domain-containing protein [Roseateles albus]
MSLLPSPSWKLPGALLLLSLVPVAAGAVRLLDVLKVSSGGLVTAENTRFMTMPGAVLAHIVAASLFCVLGAFQFDAAIRLRFPRLHRITGRVVALSGILTALTGLWMTAGMHIPAELQGELLYGARLLVGICMLLAISVSIRAVLRGRIAQHKAWMIRAYALGQGAGTQVLIMLPVALTAGTPTFFFRDILMTSAWGLNAVFAEWLIRRRWP